MANHNKALDLWREGLDAQAKHQAKLAIEKFKQASKQDPDFEDVYHAWAETSLDTDNPDAALAELQQTIEKYYDKAMGYYIVGGAYLKLEHFDKAIAAYKKCIEHDANFTDAYVGSGYAHSKLEQYAQASDYYEQASVLGPLSSYSYHNWGWVLARQGKFTIAIEKYSQAQQLEPANEQIYQNWSVALKALPQPQNELSAFRQVIETDFPTAKGYCWLGEALAEANMQNEALVAFKQSIGLDPNYTDAYIQCGIIHNSRKEYSEAIEYYRQAIQTKPDSAWAYNNWGAVLANQKDYASAIQHYRRALQINPDYNVPLSNWAKAIKRLPDPQTGLAEFRQAIESDFPSARGYYELGITLWEQQQHADALATFERAIDQDPSLADAYVYCGLAHDKLGELDKAISCYQQASNLNPDSALTYNNWGWVLEQKQDFVAATEKYKQALRVDSSFETAYANWLSSMMKLPDPEAELISMRHTIESEFSTAAGYNALGRALYTEFKRYDEARQCFNKAIQVDPEYADAHFNLGNLLRDMFLYDEAMEKYQLVVKIEDHAYFYHNHAHVLQKLGRYKQSKHKWKETYLAYKRHENEDQFVSDSWFHIYFGSLCQEIFRDFKAAEQLYIKAKNIDPNNHNAYFALAKLYLEQKESAISDDDMDGKTRNVANFKAWEAFRHAEKLLLGKCTDGQDTANLLDLAELYIAFDKHESAQQYLDTILKKDPDQSAACINRGVLHLNKKQYGDAIKFFLHVLAQNPDDLDTRSKLARTYQKQGRNDEAENEYQKVLSIAGHHIESLIGLSDVYIAQAEETEKRGNSSEAVVYFDKAIHRLNMLLKYTKPIEVSLPEISEVFLNEPTSRNLTKSEISSIYYSLGYAKTKLSEARKHSNSDLLVEAKNHFTQVKPGTPNYFKAERARNKINDLLNSLKKSTSSAGASIVAILALVIFVLSQIGFFIGKPVIARSELIVNPVALDKLIEDAKIDVTKYQAQISKLKSGTFTIEHQITLPLTQMLGNKAPDKARLADLIQPGGALKLQGFEQIGEATYGLLTFGAMIFMVAGLFLREITKLKFGAVELEKASIEHAAVATSLNITRSSAGADV